MKAKARRTHDSAAKQGYRIGPIGEAISVHERAFLHWLIEQTPEGSTISETLVAIAVDVRNEEAEKQ